MNNSIREWTNQEVAVFNSPVFTSMVEKTANYFTTFGETELGRVIATYPPYATCFDLNSRQLALTTLMSVSLSGVALEDDQLADYLDAMWGAFEESDTVPMSADADKAEFTKYVYELSAAAREYFAANANNSQTH